MRYLPGLVLLCSLLSGAVVAAGEGSVEGRLLAVQEDDFAGDSSRRIHYIENPVSGERTRLHLDRPDDLVLGTTLRVRGTMVDGEMHVTDMAAGIELLAVPAVAGGTDVRRAVVMVVDFADSNVGCSDSSIAGIMFDGAQSVDELYQETSFGTVSFPGDTDGNGSADVHRVSIANSVSESCDAFSWATAADAAAQSAGVDLGLYQHRVYVLPNTSCSWAGLANVGCFGTCRAWIETCPFPDVYAHELGHNLGLRHASTDENNNGSPDCEYCDRSDFMGIGGAGWRQVNGPHKLEMGWVPGQQVVQIDQQARQTVTLSPLETDPALAPFPQVLRISRSNGDPYHLSYRVRTGYDSTLNNAYSDKASIHVHGGSGNTLFIDALSDGETFTDAVADISIRQVSHDGSAVTLEVEVLCAGDPQCGEGGGGDPLGVVNNLRRTDSHP